MKSNSNIIKNDIMNSKSKNKLNNKSKNRLIIIGASGHGRVIADIAALNSYDDIVFLDGDSSITDCAGYHVLGLDTEANRFEGDVFIAVGNAQVRKKLMDKYSNRFFPVLVHPSATVAKDAEIGAGSVIMAGAVINPGVKVGRGSIINTSSSVDHDCVIGDFVHIAVGAHLSGTVVIGDNVWIGTGAIVSNNVNICGGCTIGAGAVVIRDIDIPGTYIGVPAMIYKKHITSPRLSENSSDPLNLEVKTQVDCLENSFEGHSCCTKFSDDFSGFSFRTVPPPPEIKLNLVSRTPLRSLSTQAAHHATHVIGFIGVVGQKQHRRAA